MQSPGGPGAFHQLLLAAFPPEPFHGPVSDHDECDDGLFLRTHLPGKRWDELTPDVLFRASIALPLLLPEALRAFLPAWLLHAAFSTSIDDVTTDFTIYFVCPGNPEEGWQPQRAVQKHSHRFQICTGRSAPSSNQGAYRNRLLSPPLSADLHPHCHSADSILSLCAHQKRTLEQQTLHWSTPPSPPTVSH